jgi:serine palmitoyltransferase
VLTPQILLSFSQDDLRRVLESVAKNDKQLGRTPNAQRRFIICEGLFKNTGQIAALDKIVAMKHEFHYRLILDESFSFGTLGATGKGALELFNKKLMHDAEVVTIALENAVGSIGGVTIGNEEIVDHQRLSGSGYCFSAASPPFTASAAIASLKELQTRPHELMGKLNDNRQYMYDKLQTFCELQEDLILISSDIRSPIVFLVLAECAETEDIDESVFLSEVVRECLRRGVGMVCAGQHNTRAGVQLLRAEPQPSIRLCVTAAHTKDDIDFAVTVLSEALAFVMHHYVDGGI